MTKIIILVAFLFLFLKSGYNILQYIFSNKNIICYISFFKHTANSNKIIHYIIN